MNVRVRLPSNPSRNSASSMALSHTYSGATDPEHGPGEGSEEVGTTEVVSVGPQQDGHVRVQLAFRSQLLSQQRARLDTSEMELKSMRRDLHMRDELQEEQKAVLKRFQKIVTRDFGNIQGEERLSVTVFVFEARQTLRSALEALFRGLGYVCHAFDNAKEGAA